MPQCMSTVEANKLLEQINHIKYGKYKLGKPKKRKNESDRDFIFRTNGYKCRYTNRRFPKHKLSLITLYPERTDIPKWKNLGVASTELALEKGSMNDDEFRDYLLRKRKIVRQEVSKEVKQKVLHDYDHKCIYCEYEYGYTPHDRKLTVDHKIPIFRGGTNDIDKGYKNLACACEDHNFEKGTMTAPEYFRFIEKRKKSETFCSK